MALSAPLLQRCQARANDPELVRERRDRAAQLIRHGRVPGASADAILESREHERQPGGTVDEPPSLELLRVSGVRRHDYAATRSLGFGAASLRSRRSRRAWHVRSSSVRQSSSTAARSPRARPGRLTMRHSRRPSVT